VRKKFERNAGISPTSRCVRAPRPFLPRMRAHLLQAPCVYLFAFDPESEVANFATDKMPPPFGRSRQPKDRRVCGKNTPPRINSAVSRIGAATTARLITCTRLALSRSACCASARVAGSASSGDQNGLPLTLHKVGPIERSRPSRAMRRQHCRPRASPARHIT